MTDPHPIAGRVGTFQARVIADALNAATGDYWTRRAATFEWARPRPGDYTGRATQAELVEMDRRICATRDACLARARAETAVAA